MANIFTDDQVEILEDAGYDVISNAEEIASISMFNVDTFEIRVNPLTGKLGENSVAVGEVVHDNADALIAAYLEGM